MGFISNLRERAESNLRERYYMKDMAVFYDEMMKKGINPYKTRFINYYNPTDKQKQVKEGHIVLDENITSQTVAPNPYTELFGTFDDAPAVMKDMEREPVVNSAMRSRMSGITQLDYKLIFPDNAKPNTVNLFNKQLKMIDMNYLIDMIAISGYRGYNPINLQWAERMIVKVRGLEFTDFSINYGEQLVYNATNEAKDIRNFYPCINRPTNSNMYGDSLLANVYASWKFKKESIGFWGKYSEVFGFPLLAMYWDGYKGANAKERSAFVEKAGKMLENIYQNSYGIFSKDVKIESLTTGSSSGADVHAKLIEYLDKQISRCILYTDSAQFATPGRLGDNAEASQMFQVALESDRKYIQTHINTILGFVGANNLIDPSEFPMFVLSDGSNFEQEKIKSEIDLNLITMGAEFTKEYIESRYSNITDTNFIFDPTQSIKEEEKPVTDELNEPIQDIGLLNGISNIQNNVIIAQTKKEMEKDEQKNNERLEDFINGKPLDDTIVEYSEIRNQVIQLLDQYGSVNNIKKRLKTIYNKLDDENLTGNIEKFLLIVDMYGRSIVGTDDE